MLRNRLVYNTNELKFWIDFEPTPTVHGIVTTENNIIRPDRGCGESHLPAGHPLMPSSFMYPGQHSYKAILSNKKQKEHMLDRWMIQQIMKNMNYWYSGTECKKERLSMVWEDIQSESSILYWFSVFATAKRQRKPSEMQSECNASWENKRSLPDQQNRVDVWEEENNLWSFSGREWRGDWIETDEDIWEREKSCIKRGITK